MENAYEWNKQESFEGIIFYKTSEAYMESLRTLYFALMHPHLSYGIIAWGSADKSITRQTNLLQKRAIRIITNSAFNSHT